MHGNVVDITGQRYNNLVVISRADDFSNDNNRNSRWLCRCDCGNEKIITKGCLLNGQKTCGVCIWISKRQGVLPLENKLVNRTKKQAEDRGYSWELSNDEARRISRMPCNYCGSMDKRKNSSTGELFSLNGLDRIDNSKGYINGNVVPCCKTCNHAKNNLSVDEFLAWTNKVYNYQRSLV